MTRYILRRLIYTIPTLLIVAIIAFLMIHFIPGGPASSVLGLDAPIEQIEAFNEKLGLDKPIIEQFFNWIIGALQGDLGDSFSYNQPVSDLIADRYPVTLQLTLVALFISLLIGVPLGILSAIKQGTYWDQLILLIAIIGIAMPDFWLALSLVNFFAVDLGWFPTGRYVAMSESLPEWFRHILLPAFSLGFIYAAVIMRMTRSSLLDVMNQDYMKTARAKGQSEFVVITKHALRNALVPIMTVIGLNMTALMGGAVVIENIFSLPGLGRLMISAIQSRDYPVIQGSILVIALTTIVISLIIDILYKIINPRIKLEE